jgi:hypothetical protein
MSLAPIHPLSSRYLCAAARRSCPSPATLASQPAAAAPAPQELTHVCIPRLRRISAPSITDFCQAWLLNCRPTGPGLAWCGWCLAGPFRRVAIRGSLCSSTGASASRATPGHPRSPAASKTAAAARERRHPSECCSTCVFAGAPDGREAVDVAVRA